MKNKEIDEMLKGIDGFISAVPEDLPESAAVAIYVALFGGALIRLLGELVKRLPEGE